MFRTIQRTRGSTGTSASFPSFGAGDVGKQGGDGKQSAGGAEGKSEQVEEEPLDYEPSPVREKDKEKTPPHDDDVYSLSTLSPPSLGSSEGLTLYFTMHCTVCIDVFCSLFSMYSILYDEYVSHFRIYSVVFKGQATATLGFGGFRVCK
jgi:hypothetical protein